MIIHPKFRAEQLTSLAKPHQSWGMLGVFKHLKSSKHPETSGVHLANHYIFVVFLRESRLPGWCQRASGASTTKSTNWSAIRKWVGMPRRNRTTKTGISTKNWHLTNKNGGNMWSYFLDLFGDTQFTGISGFRQQFFGGKMGWFL